MLFSFSAVISLLMLPSIGENNINRNINTIRENNCTSIDCVIQFRDTKTVLHDWRLAECKNLGEVKNSWLKTDAQDRAALLPGQWLRSDREKESRNSNLSFWKASKFNALQGNACAYRSIAERHEFYDFADAYLNSTLGAKKSKWFKAANIVTSWNAIGAAERINLWYLNDKTESFLVNVNKYLFAKNIVNFKSLMEGKSIPKCQSLSGKKLDYCLVELEQSELHTFLVTYWFRDLGSIARKLESSFKSPFAPSEVKAAMRRAFPSNGEKFNFLDERHRVKFGKAIIDELY